MLEVIITAVVTLVGTLVPGGIIFHRQNKRIKEAEAKKQEIENSELVIHQWKERVEDIKRAKELVDTNYNALIKKYEELQDKYEDKQKENQRLELMNQELCWWKCIVRGCSNRKPPRDIDELEAKEADEHND